MVITLNVETSVKYLTQMLYRIDTALPSSYVQSLVDSFSGLCLWNHLRSRTEKEMNRFQTKFKYFAN